MPVAIATSDINEFRPLRLFKVTGLTGTSIPTVSNTAVDITVTGVKSTDVLLSVTPGVAAAAGLGCISGLVKADNTVTVYFVNPTAGSVTSPTALNFIVAPAV
jgi:hypothetical protein